MIKRRAKNLGDKEIADIVVILDGWTGKLSWELLINVVAARGCGHYTRQALHKHERIRHAFNLRKANPINDVEATLESTTKEMNPELQAALQRIARLEAQNQRITAENQQLLEQFVCWAYNAHTRGLTKEFLSQPLPPVAREQSRTISSSKSRRDLRVNKS